MTALYWTLFSALLCGLTVGVNLASAQVWRLTAAPTNLDWTSVACSADGTKVVAAAEGGIICTSSDSGSSWRTNKPPGDGFRLGPSVTSSADGTRFAAAAWDGFFGASTNSGRTWLWSPTKSASAWHGSIVSSADGTRLASPRGYTSTNSGLTWESHEYYHYGRLCSSADGGKLVATAHTPAYGAPPFSTWNRDSGRIYLSSDAGVTWAETSAPSLHWNCIACSSILADKLVAAADEGIYTSGDAGTTWKMAHTATNLWWGCAASSADGTKLAVAGTGGVCLSADSGATWMFSPPPTHLTNVSAVASSSRWNQTISGISWLSQYIGVRRGPNLRDANRAKTALKGS